ncbi:hypothetical protein SAMN05428945_5800 [Streptomyces sp. 2224.1]|uniref:hypothetical protein n=1 Tax=unclassified Streptomyces TaxID=2593676 RepID=UPI00089A9D6E|nr:MULTISPECIES: hypothetical protein [unclassified Streptomyces]PBC86649.1 hypothetical protein BX261_6752 [Streptomyces sp. 2321.6]SED85881.1 hypothetical protein SAMN05428945_5800 [Streptomyces sp. 2224.1]SEE05108.1 hypothetical protein SAMN05428940_6778 [Streptomyces sp. 2133.1]SNC73786.1 hypothetical protein SAMN06272741_6681 [Streptomyces sp. 2114.4]
MTHFSRIPSRVAGALLTGAVLCGTAACTTSGDHTAASGNINAAPVAAVQKAVDKGAKLNSVSYQLSGRVPGQGTVDGKVSFSMRPRAIDMRMKASGGKEEGEFSVRLVGDAVYLGGDGKATAALGGKHWIKFAMKDKGADALGGMQQQADQDPAAQASLLTQSDDVKKVGEETVDGVRTSHYAGVVEVADLLNERGAKSALDAERRKKVIEQYQQLGVSKLTLDIWIGPGDRTVKFRERAQAAQGPLDVSIRFFDVNKPVRVQVPPASDTVDLEQKLKEAGKRLG